MNKRVRTGVSSFVAIVALAMVCAMPTVAVAAPIVHGFNANADGTVQAFEGLFDFDNDVALVSFVLGEGIFDFKATTTSGGTGGFDPQLGLYYAPVGSQFSLYTYAGPEGEPISASVDDVDFPGVIDAALSLTLSGAGSYILALTQTGNFLHEDFTFDWAADEVACAAGPLGVCDPADAGVRAFAGTIQITDTTNPVPEPGTLSLLALGSLATAAVRRRRNRPVMTSQ
jgi:hypothetical protein